MIGDLTMALTKCKECGNPVSNKAEACPKCGFKVKKMSLFTKVLLGILAMIFIGPLVFNSGGKDNSNTKTASAEKPASQTDVATNSEPSTNTQPVPATPITPESAWRYFDNTDAMTSQQTRFAVVISSNTVDFDFPYSGIQHANLTLRTHPRHGKDVIFAIEKGQILCPSYDGCTVLVRFDDKPAQKFSASGAADNSTETLFISNYSKFVGLLMKSKTVRISAPIYQQGSPIFEFNVDGFDQNKYLAK